MGKAPFRENRFQVRVRGRLAMFTNPLATSERWSYDVITPPAAMGVLDAVMWHPGMRWVIDKIGLLAPIQHISIRTNEIKNVVRVGPKPCYVDTPEQRTQRNNLLLRDVDYLVESHIELTADRYAEDSVQKFVRMFAGRMDKGQHYYQPYLGCTDYPADVSWYEGDPQVIPVNRDFGMMNCGYWDGPRGRGKFIPAFWPAKMVDGLVEVPDLRGVAC